MKNSEIRRLIKTAYDVKPSRKAAFLQMHQRRKLNCLKLLAMQLQYMKAQTALIGGYVLAVLLCSFADLSPSAAELLAAVMPAAALVAMTGLGRSAKYKMEELEMASRFSLRMIKILRLSIIGAMGTVIIPAVSCVLMPLYGKRLPDTLPLVGIPYLITTFSCMLLIRKWHSPKNIYGCAGIAAVVCMAMTVEVKTLAVAAGGWLLFVILAICLALTVTEGCRYIRESEEFQWN